eukprot:1481059-Prymnesium_polylepis.1
MHISNQPHRHRHPPAPNNTPTTQSTLPVLCAAGSPPASSLAVRLRPPHGDRLARPRRRHLPRGEHRAVPLEHEAAVGVPRHPAQVELARLELDRDAARAVAALRGGRPRPALGVAVGGVGGAVGGARDARH